MPKHNYLETFFDRLILKLSFEYDKDDSGQGRESYINDRLQSIADQLVASTLNDTLGGIKSHTHELHITTSDYGELERYDTHETQPMKDN